MEMHEYLRQYEEEVPHWLNGYKEGDNISFKDVISSRIAYYPGFWRDGTMLKVGNMSHSVHSFIHLDYLNKYDEDMSQVNKLPGYRSIGHFDWTIEDLLPNGLSTFQTDYRLRENPDMWTEDSDNHYFTEIMERLSYKDETYGAERIALTFLCADGIDFYFQLFVEEYKKGPWLFLLQEHGLGGCNYDRFGKNSLMDRIMTESNLWPEFVICENKNARG